MFDDPKLRYVSRIKLTFGKLKAVWKELAFTPIWEKTQIELKVDIRRPKTDF